MWAARAVVGTLALLAASLLSACGTAFTQSSGGGDAGVDDSGQGSWCSVHAPNALFCDDFDESKNAADGWSTVTATASYALDQPLNAPSPPSVLKINAAPGMGAVFAEDWSSRAPTSDVRLDFNLSVEKAEILDGLSSVFLAGIGLPTIDRGAVGIFLSQQGELVLLVSDGSDAGRLPTFIGTGVRPSLGTWTGPMRLVVTFGSNPHAQVFVGGNAVGNAAPLPASLQHPPGVELEIGVYPERNVGNVVVSFDNVSGDVK